VAEHRLAARGYTSVTLKDIANQLGIKQASLYYHFPGGKENLYMEVMILSIIRTTNQGINSLSKS
jgi:AcrR family transcriptional regulator